MSRSYYLHLEGEAGPNTGIRLDADQHFRVLELSGEEPDGSFFSCGITSLGGGESEEEASERIRDELREAVPSLRSIRFRWVYIEDGGMEFSYDLPPAEQGGESA